MKNLSGYYGEIEAVRYLREQGYRLMAANYQTRMGEIDIVAKKDNILAVVEVKSRLDAPYLYSAAEAVDYHKQRRIQLATQRYLQQSKYDGFVRFDVIEVYFNEQMEVVKINHIQNSF